MSSHAVITVKSVSQLKHFKIDQHIHELGLPSGTASVLKSCCLYLLISPCRAPPPPLWDHQGIPLGRVRPIEGLEQRGGGKPSQHLA